ncbi:hypothetical protein [Nocardiopsis tropica]|uniref:HTH cro/C1-type domain-containing protein n=1 Tax=Nocardiopsis tropica TaxID=109330 RepID=A0ABV2A4S8_9ACTN
MDTRLIHSRIAQCGATVREIADLMGIHPHHLDADAFRRLPELPTRVLVDLASRLDLHPADLVPDLEPVLGHHRQNTDPDQEVAAPDHDARLVLVALAHAGAPLHTHALCRALDWPQHRLQAALGHLQDHPELAGPLALRRTGPHTFSLGARMDVLTAAQRAALDGADGQAGPIGAEEAAVLAAMLGLGPAPQGAAWKAGAGGLAAAGLADYTAEDEFVVDPAVRFSLLPEHPPSAGDEAEGEH